MNDALLHLRVLVCPECVHGGPLAVNGSALVCPGCQRTYPVRDGIPVFAAEPGYWNNVDRRQMQRALAEAERSGDWREAMERMLPRYIPAVAPRHRADAQFLFPIGSDSRVLDAGCMWGGLTFPIAQYCREVYAVDKTRETLQLLEVRARQGGVSNVHPILAPIAKLPFPDGFFDFAVLNGVLEWLATDQEVVVEKHLQGRWESRRRYAWNPEQMQLQALRELNRVTRPGGGLYVAIENRVGLQYFCGWPDDHVGIPFASLLPRALANLITGLFRNSEYRTYTYSPGKLAGLLRRAGYREVKLHAIHPYYGKIASLVPFSIFNPLRQLATRGYADIRVMLFSFAWRLMPRFFARSLAPSIGAIAMKAGPLEPPRVIRLLEKARILENGAPSRYEAALVNSRYGDLHTANHVIFDTAAQKPVLFCKVSRSPQSGLLERESRLLQYAASRLAGTPLAERIPALLYYGVVEGVPLQATSFLDQTAQSEGLWGHLRRLDKVFDLRSSHLAPVLDPLRSFADRRWLRSADHRMRGAIDLLAQFQLLTTVRTQRLSEICEDLFTDRVAGIQENGFLSPAVQELLASLRARLTELPNVTVPICMGHGDFDLCNLLGDASSLILVDFEHAQEEGFPFFDLGNLLLSPLVTQWKTGHQRVPLADYARRSGWLRFLRRWVARYSELAGLPMELLEWLPALAAVEQNAIRFPEWRDPFTYPLFGEDVLVEMLTWRLGLESLASDRR